jgi:hypothetical protein
MRGRIIGVYALLGAGASQAQPVSEPYAQASRWEITTENHRACMMKRFYVLNDSGDEQALVIFYDAQRKAAVLGWGTRKPKLPPLSDSLDFELSFTLKGTSRNASWGNQTFQIQKLGDEYRFSHVFRDSTDSDRVLRDLASSDTIGLWLGPTLMMALPLSASDAVTKLRECSSKLVAEDNFRRSQK